MKRLIPLLIVVAGCSTNRVAFRKTMDRDVVEKHIATSTQIGFVKVAKESDAGTIHQRVRADFVSRVRALRGKYAELDGFPFRIERGRLLLDESVLMPISPAPRAPKKWRPGFVSFKLIGKGIPHSIRYPVRMDIGEGLPETGRPGPTQAPHVVFECATGNEELRVDLTLAAVRSLEAVADRVVE